MKNENNQTQIYNRSVKNKVEPIIPEAENPMVQDDWWADFSELQLEKSIKAKMKTADPAKVDFSKDFFDKLHDKVMAEVEQKEVRPLMIFAPLRFAQRIFKI